MYLWPVSCYKTTTKYIYINIYIYMYTSQAVPKIAAARSSEPNRLEAAGV